MPLLQPDQQQLADRLHAAYQDQQALAQDQIPSTIQPDAAYKVQHAVTQKKAQNGEALAAYKISLTSPETQALFHSKKPLYGALTAPALSNGRIEHSSLLSPLIEIELVFLVQETISAADSAETILKKTAIAPGIEVPDCRFIDWFPNITLGQVIADSAVSGRLVIGKPVSDVSYEQLANMHGELVFNGEQIASGHSTEVLKHPVHAIQWLAAELESHGLVLEHGLAVSSGTFILPKPLEIGRYEARYEGLGSVELLVY